MKNILLIGGHGMLGLPVARQLKHDGFSVSLLARSPDAVRSKLGDEFDVLKGDVEDKGSLESIFPGFDGVHVNLSGGPLPEDYDRIEHLGTANVAAAAKPSGIQRITYLTGTSSGPDHSYFYATAAKWAGEQAVHRAGIPYTIFRASWFMESLPLFATEDGVNLVGDHINPIHWLSASDYAAMVSKAYQSKAAENQTYYIYGPKGISISDAIKRYQAENRPELPLVRTSASDMISYAQSVNDHATEDFARLMNFFETFIEDKDPEPANMLLGAPTVTLDQWLNERQSTE
ncbi:hypothetical protein GCM10009096_03820 [Parasphingorhabdus litoris]|uniref:NAD(P)-binding domain-containing protein n=1 Tax=Parasphingorhabdus litoris TaxID=394733 RepID=A0ABP3JYX3_9SPHN|nr:NAD(P)H-binding protein [Parasphingorhabdus litoris]